MTNFVGALFLPFLFFAVAIPTVLSLPSFGLLTFLLLVAIAIVALATLISFALYSLLPSRRSSQSS